MTDPAEPMARTMNLRDEILKYTNNPKNQPVSMQEIAQYAQSLHEREMVGMRSELADADRRVHDLGNTISEMQCEIDRRYGIGGELIAARRERDALRAALRLAIRQNSHDMVMTADEIRICESSLAQSTAGIETEPRRSP